MKLVAALIVIVATLSTAVYVHQRRVPVYTHLKYFSATPDPTVGLPNLAIPVTRRPAWEDPVAVLLTVGGIAVASGILTVRRRAMPESG